LVRTVTYLLCQLIHNAQARGTQVCKEPEKVKNLVRVGNLEKGHSYPSIGKASKLRLFATFRPPSRRGGAAEEHGSLLLRQHRWSGERTLGRRNPKKATAGCRALKTLTKCEFGRGSRLWSWATPLVLFSTSEEKRGRGFRNGMRVKAWRQALLCSEGKALKGEPQGCSGVK